MCTTPRDALLGQTRLVLRWHKQCWRCGNPACGAGDLHRVGAADRSGLALTARQMPSRRPPRPPPVYPTHIDDLKDAMLTDRTTLSQFLIEERRRYPGASGELNSPIRNVALACKALACKAIAKRVAYGELDDRAEARANVQGETQQKLDVVANELFLRANEWGGLVAGMASRASGGSVFSTSRRATCTSGLRSCLVRARRSSASSIPPGLHVVEHDAPLHGTRGLFRTNG